MPYIDSTLKLKKLLNRFPIPLAETAKIAVVRPTTHFKIVTADNPDMAKTLEEQIRFVDKGLAGKAEEFGRALNNGERQRFTNQFMLEFQQKLSDKAHAEQTALIAKMEEHGVATADVLEDKVLLASSGFDYYTDMIFATDPGQAFDKDGQLTFIPACFLNRQRQGEERLAVVQAENMGAKIAYLKNQKGHSLTFEGGDIRQMPGKKLFFIGQGHRSGAEASKAIARVSGYIVLPIILKQKQFYHLDCCFLPLPNDAAVIYEGDYIKDTDGETLFDNRGWPLIEAGTETMDENSRGLIRMIYPSDKLITISKLEALAFATNTAILQSQKDGRFRMFVNGDREKVQNEAQALKEHKISYTQANFDAVVRVTCNTMDIVETPYSTMHRSGGSVRCTVQEVACAQSVVERLKNNPQFATDQALKFEARATQQRPFVRARSLSHAGSFRRPLKKNNSEITSKNIQTPKR